MGNKLMIALCGLVIGVNAMSAFYDFGYGYVVGTIAGFVALGFYIHDS